MAETSITRVTKSNLVVDGASLLPQSPPPRVAHWMAGLLIALFVAAALGSVLVKVNETVRCPLVLSSERGEDPIQAPLDGVIVRVCVAEGSQVAAGADLFILRSDEVRTWRTELLSAQEDLRALEPRVAKLEELHQAQLAIKDEEIQQVEKELAFRQKHLETSRDFLSRHEKLAREGLISQVELIQQQLEAAESEKDLNLAQRTLQQVALQRKQAQTDRARERSDEQARGEKLKLTIAALQQQLENTEADRLHVRAPVAAVVTSLSHRDAGSVVKQGGELCQLARLGDRLLARFSVGEQGVPRLAAGQKVKLLLEAFPFQRYGVLEGRIERVSPAAVRSAAGSQFEAWATLDHQSFGGGGHEQPLRAGMKGEARIVVGQRRLIEFALEPLWQLREQAKP